MDRMGAVLKPMCTQNWSCVHYLQNRHRHDALVIQNVYKLETPNSKLQSARGLCFINSFDCSCVFKTPV